MDVLQTKECELLTAKIFKEFRHPDVHRIFVTPNVGRIDIEVEIMRDKFDSALIKEFAEKDLQISRKHPNMRIHFEYRFLMSEGVTTTAGAELRPGASLSFSTLPPGAKTEDITWAVPIEE